MSAAANQRAAGAARDLERGFVKTPNKPAEVGFSPMKSLPASDLLKKRQAHSNPNASQPVTGRPGRQVAGRLRRLRKLESRPDALGRGPLGGCVVLGVFPTGVFREVGTAIARRWASPGLLHGLRPTSPGMPGSVRTRHAVKAPAVRWKVSRSGAAARRTAETLTAWHYQGVEYPRYSASNISHIQSIHRALFRSNPDGLIRNPSPAQPPSPGG